MSRNSDNLILQMQTEINTLEELIERSNLGYHSLDGNGIILQVNQVWLDTLGYTREEVIGVWFGKFIHESYIEKFKTNFPKLKEKGIIENFTFVLKTKDGSPVELVFNGMAEKDPDGNFLKTHSAFVRQSSEKKVLEGNIEEKIINKSRLELLEEMMSAIAHQWRQPLNALGLLVQDTDEILAFSGTATQETKENTEKAMALILSLSKTIEQFTDFFVSKGEEENINITKILMDSIKIIFPQLQNKNIDFSFICECSRDYFHCSNNFPEMDCGPHIHYIKGSVQDIKQIFFNIIFNSKYEVIKAMEEGKIPRGSIDIHIRHTDSEVVLSISNNGDRIAEDILPRIFDPYFTTKPQGDGVGMGLFITRTIIEKHLGGSISVANTDTGVMTVVTFPVAVLSDAEIKENNQAE